MFKGFLSVCRLFSLASFSPGQRKRRAHTQYRRRLCGFLGPADSSHPPLVFAPSSSSSGSQAARHGRIPKPVPRLVCSSPILAWIRHCVPDVLRSRSSLFSDIGFDHFENISRSSCASVCDTRFVPRFVVQQYSSQDRLWFNPGCSSSSVPYLSVFLFFFGGCCSYWVCGVE